MKYALNRKITFTIAILLLFLSMGLSQDGIQPQKYYLDNGLEVILVEMNKCPIIFQRLIYKVGSKNEPVGKTGISHVVEHMMFKGTEKFPTGSISKLIKRNGGVFNAFTSSDITVYYEQLPKNKIDIALEVESDRMMNSIFDPEEFESEINVIKEERRLRVENNPSRIWDEELTATFYMSHPYHWPVIGWMNDLNQITRADAYKYYKTYYTPNNAVLVLAGDFNKEKMLEKVKKYFGKIPRGPKVPAFDIQEPEIRTMKSVTKKSPSVVNPEYEACFQGVDYTSEDYPALRLAANILSRGRTSRLYKKLVKTRLCSRAGLKVLRYMGMGPIVFSAELYPETDLDTVKSIFRAEIDKMKTEPVRERELRREKNRYKVDDVYDNMKVSQVGSRIGTYEVKAGDYKYYHKLQDAFDAVTTKDIMNVMNKYLNFNYYVEGHLLPGDSSLVTKTEHSAMDEKDSITEDIHEDEEENVETEQEDIPFDPEEIIKPNPIAPNLTQFSLSNGIKVIFYEDHSFPILELAGIIDIGNTKMSKGKEGLGQTVCSLINQGSEKYPYETLIDTLSMLATGVHFRGGSEYVLFSWGTIKENFEAITDIGNDVLQNPTFPEEQFKNIQKKRVSMLKSAEKKTGWKISRYVVEKIFQNHPYFRPITPESVEGITLDDVEKYYQEYFHPEVTKLVVLGDISQPELKQLLEKYLGNWTTTKDFAPIEIPEQKPLQSIDIKVYTNYEDKQVNIRIAHDAPSKHHPDYEKLEIANHILGGSSLTSRLGINIRDKQGLTYGITSKLKGLNEGGWWYLQSKTEPKNVGQLLLSAIDEIQRMRNSLVSETELNDAKRYYLGILPMVVEDPVSIFRLVTDNVRSKIALDDFDNYPDRLLKISRNDVLNVSKKYFHPEKSVITVGGPLTAEELQQSLIESFGESDINFPIDFSKIKVGVIE